MKLILLAGLMLATPVMAETICNKDGCATNILNRVPNCCTLEGICVICLGSEMLALTGAAPTPTKPPPRCDKGFFPVQINGGTKCVGEVREPK